MLLCFLEFGIEIGIELNRFDVVYGIAVGVTWRIGIRCRN